VRVRVSLHALEGARRHVDLLPRNRAGLEMASNPDQALTKALAKP
jgi:hypothetical protein